MKKTLLSVAMLTALVLGCTPPPKIETKNIDTSKIKVKEFIALDTLNEGNTVVLAKICTEHVGFKYMYQLKNNTWIASNTKWYIGTRIKISSDESK